MRESERIDPRQESDRIVDRLIDLARASQRPQGDQERAILRAIAPLLDAVDTGSLRLRRIGSRDIEAEERTKIPFLLKSLDADEVAELLGITKRYFLEHVCHHAMFPRQANPEGQRPRWIAGEVVDWRIDARPKLNRKSVRTKKAASPSPELGRAPSQSTDTQKAFLKGKWPYRKD